MYNNPSPSLVAIGPWPSNKWGDMCYIAKGFLLKGTKNGPMLYFILNVSGDMIWIISSGSMATTIISQIQMIAPEIHRETEPEKQWELPVPIRTHELINKIQIHVKIHLDSGTQKIKAVETFYILIQLDWLLKPSLIYLTCKTIPDVAKLKWGERDEASVLDLLGHI